jgi:hypothetical protein
MMSLVEFEMDLGDAGQFDFIIEYQYYPAETARWPGEKDEPEHVIVESITYGGISWEKQLGKIIENDEKFILACRQEWLDELAEHTLRLAGI